MIGLLVLVLTQNWQQCAPMPTPGFRFASAAVGSRIYAIGGLIVAPDSSRQATEAYDVPADSWLRGLAPMPGPKWDAGCAELDGKVYVIGGTDGHSDLSRVDRYAPSSNTWDTVAPLPWPRSALAGCAYGGCIYAIGGHSGATYERTVARFTPDSGAGRWDVVESLWTPRTSPAAAVAAGKMCAVGGKYYSSDLSSFETYHPGMGWSPSAVQMHHSRSGGAAVGWGPWLCAIGGQSRGRPMSSVEIVNADSGPWRDTTSLSVERAFCGAAVADGFVVVMGGQDLYGATEASVEKNNSIFPPGIEEPETRTPVKTALRWATVASKRVRITCRSAAIYDGSGHRVFAGSGPVDAQFAPGVYFARVTDENGRPASGRITVVR
ncbi:MAG TPA: kelch repeat-containing protein [bacterium]|nr:kelch repeat-containing protein [bacterium]